MNRLVFYFRQLAHHAAVAERAGGGSHAAHFRSTTTASFTLSFLSLQVATHHAVCEIEWVAVTRQQLFDGTATSKVGIWRKHQVELLFLRSSVLIFSRSIATGECFNFQDGGHSQHPAVGSKEGLE